MPNHLTPEELSKELGIDRTGSDRVCVQEGVPIYQGKIDKILFQAQLQAIGASAASSTELQARLTSSRRLRASRAALPRLSSPAPCAPSPRRRSS